MRKSISIIIVARNEEENLVDVLNDVSLQDYPHNLIDVILIDSISEDKTKKIMLDYKKKSDFNRVLVLNNPGKILSKGWNLGIESSSTDLVVRIDAHASIPSNFITENVKVIINGERASGGARPNILSPNDKSKWQETLLLSESSLFGSSIAPYRNSKEKKYVNSIFHGVYDKKIFEEVGLLNPRLGRTEDNEIHYRMREAGIKLAYNPTIISYQFVRSSLKKMIRQKFANGYWIGLTLAVCPKCFSLFHFVPFVFILSLIFAFLIIPFTTFFISALLLVYSFLIILITFTTLLKNKFNLFNLLIPIILFGLHISYGLGTLIGIISIPFKRKELTE